MSRELFNEGWRFYDGEIECPKAPDKGTSYIQAKTEHYLGGPASRCFPDQPDDFGQNSGEINLRLFRNVNLPHDYIISQVPQINGNKAWGFFDYHPAWYRKHFVIGSEDKDKRIALYFEGVADHATVYFNGVYMLDNHEAHVPFEIDLTDFIRFDEDNVIAIHVECGTGEGWWYQGGGIYRNVWMEKKELISVDRYGVYVHPSHADGAGNEWIIPVETTLRNDSYEETKVELTSEIVAAADESTIIASVSSEVTIGPRDQAVFKQVTRMDSPHLWDIDDPFMHKVRTVVRVSGCVKDVQETGFGFRTISFDAVNGFFLNGRNVKLQGVCGHGDYGLTGLAVDESVFRYKAGLIKQMGANAYRCSHYPQAEFWMDEMDRLGIVVMDETRWFSTAPTAVRDLKTLILRDRNHPSVIMWSVGNEEPFFITEQGARIARSLYATAKKLDSERPVLTANDKDPEIATVYEFSDIVGVNYHMELFDKLHEQYPEMPILSTENSATGTVRGWYHDNVPGAGRVSAYDHDTNEFFRSREFTWQYILDRPWLMGGMQWIAFEHRGEAEWPRLCSISGACDLYLQKKDAFYQNQSFWAKQPMIHLLPHWNHRGMEGRQITVFAYTNCEEAELFLNGRSLGKQALKPVQHAEWVVEYEPGVLEAIGYVGGRKVTDDRSETSGKPTQLRLIPENAEDVRAGGTLLLTCVALDDKGREVPDAFVDHVLFYANRAGEVIGTGSDHTDHVPPCICERRMHAGRISVAVKIVPDGGKVEVYAEAPGMNTTIYEQCVSQR